MFLGGSKVTFEKKKELSCNFFLKHVFVIFFRYSNGNKICISSDKTTTKRR